MKELAALRMAHDPTHVLPLPRAICSASPSTEPAYPRHSVPVPQHPHASPVPVPRPQSELIDYTLTLIYTCIYTLTSMTLPTHMYICLYTYIYIHTYLNVYIYIYTYICTHIYIYMYVYKYMCMYVYISYLNTCLHVNSFIDVRV